MKNLLGTLPWAVVLIGAGVVIWWLLSRDMAAGRWLLAGLIVGHAVVHVMFLAPAPAATTSGPDWPFHVAQSWPVSALGLDLGLVRIVAAALIGAMVLAFAAAALSAVGIVVPAGWWRGSVAAGAVLSAVVVLAFFDTALIMGLGIDAVLLWVVAAGEWAP